MTKYPIRLFSIFLFVGLMCSDFIAYAEVNTLKELLMAKVGAEQMKDYLPRLKNKKVALLINQTSVVFGKNLLLDTLMGSGVNVVKIFVPEHGFRGTADAGAHIKNDIDAKTGLPVISLYGKNKKPTAEQMKDVDVLVYDLQDVGVRFYTYISTLEYAMDACIENDKELIILDRPNPNWQMVDGPVLDTTFRSFVGMQPVPVVYGMTVGEYATMLVGEQWIRNASSLRFTVVPCKDYHPGYRPGERRAEEINYLEYEIRIAPSPNLKTKRAINSYPSLCFFEGTIVSVGRGTDDPFEQWGHPDYKGKLPYSFVPKSTVGATKPLLENQVCYGEKIRNEHVGVNVSYLIKAYQLSPQKDKFFNPFFEKLAGTKLLRQQIIDGKSEAEIRASWQPELDKFKKIRKKYLLYED